MKRAVWAYLLLICMGAVWLGSVSEAAPVYRIEISGTIGPATASYIERAIEEAGEQGAECLIIQLDTPGGLLESTKHIVQYILASPVPVVVYVSPSGASAGSAGCFITMAADVAAMAPATNIGAAHPVQIGGQSDPDETMEKKIESYSISYIESIAAKRNRNVEWAKKSVAESASITEVKALELKVIEIIAADHNDLLAQLDGRTAQGRTLSTRDAKTVDIPMTFREQAFQVLWRPEVLFILMLVAVYGIIGELSNPGAIIPGALGVAALVVALYMSAVLPVNVAGILLIILALALFVAEAFTPTYGLLSLAGIGTFITGSLMLFDDPEQIFRLSLVYIIPAAFVTAGFFIIIITAGLKAQLLPAKVGRQTLLGQTAPASTRIDSQDGRVCIEGEYWNAVSDNPIEKDRMIEVTGIEGLTLTVKEADA